MISASEDARTTRQHSSFLSLSAMKYGMNRDAEKDAAVAPIDCRVRIAESLDTAATVCCIRIMNSVGSALDVE